MGTTTQLPTPGVWWRQPLARVAGIWIVISSMLCCLIMCLLMLYWHVYGSQVLSSEAHHKLPESFAVKTQGIANNNYLPLKADPPVVRPSAVSNSTLTGWLVQWWPMLGLEAGKTYHLHVVWTEGLHRLQPILDKPFLPFIGIAMPLMLCIAWKVMEMLGIPLGK